MDLSLENRKDPKSEDEGQLSRQPEHTSRAPTFRVTLNIRRRRVYIFRGVDQYVKLMY